MREKETLSTRSCHTTILPPPSSFPASQDQGSTDMLWCVRWTEDPKPWVLLGLGTAAQSLVSTLPQLGQREFILVQIKMEIHTQFYHNTHFLWTSWRQLVVYNKQCNIRYWNTVDHFWMLEIGVRAKNKVNWNLRERSGGRCGPSRASKEAKENPSLPWIFRVRK